MAEALSRMPAAQVCRPTLQGRQPVAGLWFPANWLDAQQRAVAIVAAWRSGAQLFRFEEGDLLRFAAPVLRDCDALEGWPLRREAGTLCSAPLTAAERALVPAADLWLVQGGDVTCLHLAQAQPIDPSEWFAAGPALLDTFDCRELLPQAVVLDTEGRTVREVLGDAIAPASEAQREFLRAMAARAQPREQPANAPDAQPPRRGPSNALVVVGFVLALLALLALFVASVDSSGPSASAAGGAPSSWNGAVWAVLAVLLLIVLAIRSLGGPSGRERAPAPERPQAPPAPGPAPAAPRVAPRPQPGGTGWVWGLAALALLAFYVLAMWGSGDATPGRAPAASSAPQSSNGVAAPVVAWALVAWALLAAAAFVAMLVWMLRRWLGGGRGRAAGQAATAAAPSPAPATASIPPRGGARTLRSRWRDWMARMAIASRLSKLLGRQQADYLQRMLKMFDDGDLMEALRHAIPLGGDGGDAGQSFGTPGRRDNLSLSGTLGASTSIYLDRDFESHLRQLYRKSFEKLDRDGRIDEAVFVLAELLQSRHEALEYLEKHGRLPQAAELALAWDQPPGVIVRLLCLAGDWRRAIAVARRDEAFAQAVLQLQDKWPEAANRLRGEWGRSLAERGEWLQAVEAVWPVAALREQAIEWLLVAEAAQGQLAARALVLRAQLMPDTLAACAVRLQAVRDDPLLHRERAALATELAAVSRHSDASRGLVAVLTPALLADNAHGLGSTERRTLQALMRSNADPLLQADMPAGEIPGFEVQPLMARSVVLALDAPAAGMHPVHDAATLEDGRYLLALGESGVLVCDPAGRALARFAVPCHRLVIARSAQVALALAQRDGLWRVSRLDLVRREVAELGMAAIDHFSAAFDGIAWTVARGNRVQVLDTGRSLHDVLWQAGDLPGEVVALSATDTLEQFVVAEPGEEFSLWRYSLPQRRLLSRAGIGPAPGSAPRRMLHPRFGIFDAVLTAEAEGLVNISWRVSPSVGGELQAAAGEPHRVRLQLDAEWLAAVWASAAGWRLIWARQHNGAPAATLTWPSARPPGLRAVAGGWLVFDDEGRVLHLDTERGTATGFGVR